MPELTLTSAAARLDEIATLPENWDTYGAPPFTLEMISAARRLVLRCFESGHAPYLISAGEGISLAFRCAGRRYADIELYADGEVLACTSTGDAAASGISVWVSDDIDTTIAAVAAFAAQE